MPIKRVALVKKSDKKQEAWDKLQILLSSRINDAENGAISNKTFNQITDEEIIDLERTP
jgi:hypothetical protein